ncbi:hypothetical protein C3L33_03647, partial [Rhododendron williamsianum]
MIDEVFLFSVITDIESLQISGKKPPLALSEETENRIVPINRPDRGGTVAAWEVGLLANHFLVSFKPEGTILHYDVNVEPQMSRGPQRTKNFIPKMDHRRILDKLFSDDRTRLPTKRLLMMEGDSSSVKCRCPLGSLVGKTWRITALLIHYTKRCVEVEKRCGKSIKRAESLRNSSDTKQKFQIAGLSDRRTRDISFPLEDLEQKGPPRKIGLVEYFWEKYNKEILHDDIPSLDLGKANYVPMEFCTLVEGQRNVVRNFEIAVDEKMTRVVGRVLAPPALKLRTPTGKPRVIRVDRDPRCQWNLLGNSVVEGKPLKRWALIDFTASDCSRLNAGLFIKKLRNKCGDVGIPVMEPVVSRLTSMRDLSTVFATQELLDSVVKEANGKCNSRLQLIVCVLSEKHDGKKYLKWVSETKIGIMTQCCLVSHANNPNNRESDQYLANLALKINAKLGGSNVELAERLPGFPGEEHVMFIGADVYHPGPGNATCPSFAGVVASTNWPAVSRYVTRICPQEHRNERIVDFGATCLDLVNTYARLNKVKPKKIVVFRDGVSEGQFDMVLNKELQDMKSAIYEDDYRPTITLIVARKRHLDRIFVENERDGGRSGNVPPGTVVDTKIVHPFNFDFYLCSQYGVIGTSKAAHYSVLWDEHNFTSDQIQKLVYHLCFTSARCTKPVSLVPPVFYADLVAYRGRMYHEAAMELQPQTAASPSSTSAALLNEGLYKVHPDLKNELFFM